jgi:cell shape-determining protein MreC
MVEEKLGILIFLVVVMGLIIIVFQVRMMLSLSKILERVNVAVGNQWKLNENLMKRSDNIVENQITITENQDLEYRKIREILDKL